MSSSKKSTTTDRSHGGPGSSDQNADKQARADATAPRPGAPTNPNRSRVSGGGGERDIHHTHDPRTKR